MTIDLSGKRILYLGHTYFDYYKDIIFELTNYYGAEVDFYNIKPRSLIYRSIKFIKKTKKFYLSIFFNKIIKKTEGKKYDYVLMIGSEDFHNTLIYNLKKKLNCIFLMYQWDSKKKNKYDEYIDCFDKVYSFDSVDCENDKRLIYLPLFYRKIFDLPENHNADIDLLHIGSGDLERLNICKIIKEQAILNNRNFFYHLYMPFLMFLRLKLYDKNYRKLSFYDFKFKKIKDIDTAALVYRSKAILDIERMGQSGLTIRTLESLGASKKIITTNKNIAKENFFNDQFIDIIDKKKPIIDWSFIDGKHFVKKEEKEKYSLVSWLNELFSYVL